jgi:hypothetical protein
LSILFGDQTEKGRMREHHRENVDGNLGLRKIVRKIVLIGDGAEGLKANSSAHFSVSCSRSAND